jgi:uncharacterized protein (DUF488 family)
MVEVLTIGHSTHAFDRFLALLRQAEVTAVADVRTSPFSRRFRHFNRDVLREKLLLGGIAYVFLGKELGGRPTDSRLYRDGIADYEKIATTETFKNGLERVIEDAKKHRIALMCAERDPLDCHRCLLVGRALAERGVAVRHILSDGAIATHGEVEDRLLQLSGHSTDDLFAAHAERLTRAYQDRARKAAYAQS